MQDPSGHGRELISFRIGAQEFCIGVAVVREIRGWTQATPLPHAPSYVRGVINLRGAVLPIIDLAERLGLPASEPTPQHVIIVVEIGADMAGLLVSAVCGILTATEQMIQPTPDIASGSSKAYVQGLLTIENRMIGLLCAEKLVSHHPHAQQLEPA